MKAVPIAVFLTGAWLASAPASAHDGPPFPIVSDQVAGSYSLSIWTDPDTTDDGTPGGQFWVMIASRSGSAKVGPDTLVTVSAQSENGGIEQSVRATPVRGDEATRFAALVLDREGPFRVLVTIDGPGGPATVQSAVMATYNLRPPPLVVAVYLVPFILIGGLWTMLLVRRRRSAASAQHQGAPPPHRTRE